MSYSVWLYVQESSELECLVRLLQLSQRALTIIDSKEYYEDKLVSVGGVWGNETANPFCLPVRMWR